MYLILVHVFLSCSSRSSNNHFIFSVQYNIENKYIEIVVFFLHSALITILLTLLTFIATYTTSCFVHVSFFLRTVLQIIISLSVEENNFEKKLVEVFLLSLHSPHLKVFLIVFSHLGYSMGFLPQNTQGSQNWLKLTSFVELLSLIIFIARKFSFGPKIERQE